MTDTTITDKNVIAKMVRVRDQLIAYDLRQMKINDADLRIAIEGLAAKYDAGNFDRNSNWKFIAYLAHLADLAYLAYLADLAGRADRADLAEIAYLAYLADLADLAGRAAPLLGDLLVKQDDLDACVLQAITQPVHNHNQRDWGDVCGTTHCRGGWAVMQQPYHTELSEVFGWHFSACIVYKACTGSIPDFFNMDNDEVLAEIKAAAGVLQ